MTIRRKSLVYKHLRQIRRAGLALSPLLTRVYVKALYTTILLYSHPLNIGECLTIRVYAPFSLCLFNISRDILVDSILSRWGIPSPRSQGIDIVLVDCYDIGTVKHYAYATIWHDFSIGIVTYLAGLPACLTIHHLYRFGVCHIVHQLSLIIPSNC